MSQTPSTRPLVIMRYHCIFVLSVLTTGLLGSFAKHLSRPWDDMHTKHSWNTIPKNWETLAAHLLAPQSTFTLLLGLSARTPSVNPGIQGAPLTAEEQSDLASVSVVSGANGPWPKLANPGKHVLNLASYNFTGLAGNETIKVRAIETLWKYGVGSGGTPRFYVLLRGLQISRSTVRWLDHNDPKSPGDVLLSIEKERRKRRGPLSRRFIVTEGIFEKDSAMVDFPKLIELKDKYKYRLILDESISFGTVGRTGRGLTELYNVPATQIDMITRSVATGLNSSGGFCAGSRIIVDHQHINSTSFVFSAAVPALLAASASEGINILRNTPLILSKLQENPPNPATPALRDAPSFDIAGEERLLQGIVNEALAQGVWTTQARRLRGKELVEACPSIRLAVTAALSHKGCERAAGVIKAAVVKVLTRRK
ncbi:serine palmitoyltransferase [Lactarius hatsudake]|nr:serine palmitoyltransferase [Lactarius hatsudake]